VSEREGYEHGVPCWVDTWQPDAEAAVRFYEALFGWRCEETTPPGSERRHFLCYLRDRYVAGIGSPPPVPDHTPVWGTYVWVDDVDEVVARATEAGGSVAIEPFDALDGGRMAVLADPAGAVFAVWDPDENRGAQIVNEPSAWSMSMLTTRDPEAAKAFYRAIFGWTTESFEMGESEMTMFRLPGYVGGEPGQPVSREVVATMSAMDDRFPAETPAHWAVDFWIDDADAAAEKATELGGKVVAGPYDAPPFREAVLADPQGAILTVSQLVVGPEA
jgi:uncharacterized protein